MESGQGVGSHYPLGMSTSSSLPALPSLPHGLYQHYKGARYEVVGVVRHSETLEPLVLYRPIDGDGALWVRPFAMFEEWVEVNGQKVRRFARQL